MRLAESNENRGFFLEHCPIQAGTQLEGGVFQESLKRYSTPAYFYLSHSAVVIPCESAPPLPTREKGGDESDPPQIGGGRSRPYLSLREGLEQAPFPLALHRVGSVLAVKGSLRRFAPWTAAGRSERRAAYEGKGGMQIKPVILYLI